MLLYTFENKDIALIEMRKGLLDLDNYVKVPLLPHSYGQKLGILLILA